MEIGPIAGIRVQPVTKVRPAGPELTVFFDIEAAVRPEDDTFSRNGQKAAGAEEPDEEDEELSEELSEAAGDEMGSEPVPEAPADRISFFA